MKKLLLVMMALCIVAMTAWANTPVKTEVGMGAVERTTKANGSVRISAEEAHAKAAQFSNGRLDAVVTSLCNALVCVQLGDGGDFNIGTPDGRSLLYYYPNEPATSNIIISIDGMTYPLEMFSRPSCDGGATFDSWSNDSTSIYANYTINGMFAVQVIHTPVMFSGTSGAILTRTVVTNNDQSGASHAIGVLYEYDTTVDGDDAAQLYLGPNYVNVETCYDAPYAANYWDALPFSGTLVGRGTFTGGAAVTPDHLSFGQWGPMYGVCWAYACSGNPYGDSAVLYKWDEQQVGPGGTRNVATYYGVGEIQVAPGNLQLSASIPPLSCTPNGIQPNPFQALINVTNTGGETCREISVQLSNGAGPGGTGMVTSTNPQSIPFLVPNDNGAVSFTVALTPNPAGGCVYFTAVVTSSGCPSNTIEFCVEVPACEPMDCRFPYERSDMGDLFRCNYPTFRGAPAHGLSGVAWLGQTITAEANPRIFNADAGDDGVNFIGLPWTPCTAEQVEVTVTGGPNYERYVRCGGHLYLNAWKDGNIDNDFCDELCDGRVSEWIIQDVPVTPGTALYTVMDPGVFDFGVYAGVFRFRLTSVPVGRFGYGLPDPVVCPDCACPGTFGQDSVGEVEDYYMPDAQLAVNLADYSLNSVNGEVSMVWSTASETNNDRFEVMRNGTMLTSIRSQGNTASGHTYRYSDATVTTGQDYEYTLVAVDLNGTRTTLGSRTVTANGSSAATVTEYALHQNFPNPFNPTTQIAFDLVESGHVTLTVFNSMGQEVAKLVNGTLGAGSHAVSFNATGLPSGIYFYRLNVNGFSADMKMLLMK
jgi:hypothetical protein